MHDRDGPIAFEQHLDRAGRVSHGVTDQFGEHEFRDDEPVVVEPGVAQTPAHVALRGDGSGCVERVKLPASEFGRIADGHGQDRNVVARTFDEHEIVDRKRGMRRADHVRVRERRAQSPLALRQVVRRFDQAVRVEHEERIGRQHAHVAATAHVLAQAERRTARNQLVDRAVAGAHERRRMARRRVRERARDPVDHADERRDEAVGRLRAQGAVGRFEHQRRIRVNLRDAANRLPHVRHRDGRAQPGARDVADRDHDPSVAQAERVVPVAADQRFGAPRFVDRIEAKAGDVRKFRG